MLIANEILKQINQQTGEAVGLPNYTYSDPEFFKLEQSQLFAKTWTCIGSGCNIPENGDLKPISHLGVPLLLCRDNESSIRVFHNVCSHRGNELVWEACRVKKVIACPYHSWSYSLDGKLQATPHIGGHGVHKTACLDKAKHGLKEARSAVWMDLVFVNLSGDAPSFDEHIAPLQRRVERFASPQQFAQLKPAANHGNLTIKFSANWKLAIENNLDAYHLPWVHPDLNAVSKFEDHYDYLESDLFTGQGTRNYDHSMIEDVSLPMFADWPEKTAEYPTLFPNVFFGFHCDRFWTRIVEPIAVDETLDHLQLYYLGDAANSEDYEQSRKTRLEVWAKVFNEDIEVVEGMQRGRRSPAFRGGVFSDVLDKPSHYFAKWVANRLSQETIETA